MYAYQNIVYATSLFLLFIMPFGINAQPDHSSQKQTPKKWILNGNGSGEEVTGIGIADYSNFNPEKAWKEALQNGVEDLNANYSLLVYHYGNKIGQGPLRTKSEYAIRSFLDTTQVSVVDSAQWKGKAFVLVEPTISIPDSTLYPSGEFGSFEADTKSSMADGVIEVTGSTPSIDSNWHMSITKAKQDALRQLAEDLSAEISTETYKKNGQSRRHYNFSTMFAFQRIRVLKRVFDPDSVKVQVGINPQEIKMLIDK